MIRILIVDDSLVARMSLKSCLPKEELELAEAEDGTAGLALFKSFNPQVTFLDLTMPGMDGFQVLREMKKLEPASLIIILTADIQKRTIDMVTELGAFAVLKKPPQKPDVLAALKQALASTGEPNDC